MSCWSGNLRPESGIPGALPDRLWRGLDELEHEKKGASSLCPTRSILASRTGSPSRCRPRRPCLLSIRSRPSSRPCRASLRPATVVGLVEWVCIQAISPHIDWPREQTVGTRIDLSHSAPTPPGCPVTVGVELVKVEGRRRFFRVSARDDAGPISEGTHERFVIDADRFNASLSARRADA